MLNKIIKSLRPPSPPQASVPDGVRVYAVGDIHGRLDLLERLLKQIEADDHARGAAQSQLVFLGDLVDRGPDSAGVIDYLRQLAHAVPDARFLLGNHEEMFLAALDGDVKALKFFCRYGGRETILSYGLAPEEYDRLDYAALSAALETLVPQAHRDFLRSFEDMIEIGDYLFVHAGVRPGVPFDEQRRSDLRWIREPFLDHGLPLGKIVVHGHTITDEPEFRPHRIGIDTGAYASGTLTALALEGRQRWLLST